MCEREEKEQGGGEGLEGRLGGGEGESKGDLGSIPLLLLCVLVNSTQT